MEQFLEDIPLIRMLRKFEIRILRRIFGPKMTENGEWSSFHNDEIHFCKSILLNVMFHAPMGRFQLKLFIYFTYFSPSSHSVVVFSFL